MHQDQEHATIAAAMAAAIPHYWQSFQSKYPEYAATLTEKQKQLILKYWFGSEYAYQLSLKDYRYLQLCLEQSAIKFDSSDINSATQLNQRLLQYREQQSMLLIWQQQIQQVSIDKILQDTSELADTILKITVEYCYQIISARYGIPRDSEQQTIPLHILALGKLGGMELNFSSDIDLMFAYAEDGLLQSGNKEITHQEFFTKVVQTVLQVLQPQINTQRIYRVDLRLRPYGNSGAIVSSFAALERYYQEQGRDWERYALVKARLINDDESTQGLKTLLTSFVYRRYLDFSVINALRNLKQTMKTQSKVASLEQDIKRGEGGIREIEFVVQALQIIKGGRVRALRTTSLLQGLKSCEQEKLLSKKQIQHLKAAYNFYRNVENCLQMFNDQQIHHLPEESQIQQRIVVALGYDNWKTILDKLQKYQKAVSMIFKNIITPDEHAEKITMDFISLSMSEQQLQNELEKIGIDHEHELIYSVIVSLRQYIFSREASAEAKKRMTKLLPKLLHQLSQQQNPGQVFKVLQPLLIAISLRSAYLVLLLENPNTLSWLVNLASTSEWIITRITEFPMLLDELLDPQSIVKESISTKIASDDTEEQMQYLREFKLRNELIIAIKQLDQEISPQKTSTLLTNLATLIVRQVYQWAWNQVSTRYGVLDGAPNASQSKCVIVAYGNLGGDAMNYQSDLDLVLIFDMEQNKETNSDKSISTLEFYAKLFQRMLTMLTSRTTSGVLYEIDTRLRPLGNEGLLAVSLSGFKHYQLEQAWTYEHQSLIRARVIAGDRELAEQFNQVRQQILKTQKSKKDTKKDIIKMHKRIAMPEVEQLTHAKQVKNCPGGIVDIDFMVQYTVLISAKDYPQLLEETNTAALLLCIAKLNIWPVEMAEKLVTIYQFYQQCILTWTLATALPRALQKELQENLSMVKQYWQALLEDE